MTPVIRSARLEDAATVAHINSETWRTSFRGIVPDAYLDRLGTPEHQLSRTEAFRRKLAEGLYAGLFVADIGGELVGFADGGRSRSPKLPYDGELYAIYVLAGYQRTGVGRALVRAVVQHLMGLGCGSMLIWTLAASRHRSFYDGLGGVVHASVPDDPDYLFLERGGVQLPMVAYGWTDLPALERRCG